MISEQNAYRLRMPGMTAYIMVKAGLLRPDRGRSDHLVPTAELRVLWRGPPDRLMPEFDGLVEGYIEGRDGDLGRLLALGTGPAQAERLARLCRDGCDAAVAEMAYKPGLADRYGG